MDRQLVDVFRSSGVAELEATRTTSEAPVGAAIVSESHVFFWIEEGEADLFVRRRTHRIGPGSTHYIAPGELAAERRRHAPRTRSCALVVSQEAFLAFARARGLSSRGIEHSAMFLADELAVSARRAFASLERGETAADQKLRFEDLARSWCTSASVSPPTDVERRAVRRVRAYIQENVTETILLEHLVEIAGLSKFYLLRIFRDSVGVPPHAYQVCLRLARAKSLVRTRRSLAQVAADAGFSDQSHLIRHWQRAYGGTPGAYARGDALT